MIPRDLDLRVCEALGLDPTVTKSLSITFTAREAAIVQVEQFMDETRARKLLSILRHYHLRRIDE